MKTHDPRSPEAVSAKTPLWQYSVAADYRTPAQPASEKVKSGLSSLWKRFRPGRSRAGYDDESSEHQPLSKRLLADLLPEPDWDAVATSLATHLNPWLHETAPDSKVQAVIGPPGSGTQEVVARWGKQVTATSVPPPDHDRLLSPEPDFWQSVTRDTQGVLVIPELERFYLRQSDGLGLIRQLAQWLWGSCRRVVIGCDSWAWAYLCHTVRIDAVFATPIALRPLDGDALRVLFRPRPRGRYLVQTAWNGEVIYPIEVAEEFATSRAEAAEEKGEEPQFQGADIFQRIAAMSRGIPQVALALWRKCLCEDSGEASPQASPSPIEALTPIRVRRPQNLVLPSMPAGASTREAIVLHTLLLHAGLPSSILFRVVPLAASEIIATLSLLRDAELVCEHEGVWKVAPLGYTSVRAFIRAETLLIDLF